MRKAEYLPGAVCSGTVSALPPSRYRLSIQCCNSGASRVGSLDRVIWFLRGRGKVKEKNDRINCETLPAVVANSLERVLMGRFPRIFYLIANSVRQAFK